MNLKPENRISVKPIVFYPKGVAKSKVWSLRWFQYVMAAKQKYNALLKGRDTFLVSQLKTLNGDLTPAEYKELCFTFSGLKSPDQLTEDEGCSQGVETILAEILGSDLGDGKQYTRYTMPYSLAVLMVDPDREWGFGGGRNFNGVTNLGGGIMVIPSWHFDDGKLMSTLLHELGHTFGLVHTDNRQNATNLPESSALFKCYYHLNFSNSIMSYNTANWSNETDVEQIPGCLLGDEIEALSQNKLVFPDLFFNAATDFDCPPGSPPNTRCRVHDKVIRPAYLGPMHLFWCTSSFSSNQFGSILNLNDHPGRWILGSHPDIGFVNNRMWHSTKVDNGEWVSLDVTFPKPMTINRVQVYTEHSGKHHKAKMVQIEHQKNDGTFEFVKRVSMPGTDAAVEFGNIQARTWRLAFQAGASGFVAVRGLRFFFDDKELFPPLGPHALTDFGETFGSQVSNLVEIQREIRANSAAVKFDPRSMWHSDKVNEKGWVSFEVIFPVSITLDKVAVHSQHSGQFHKAHEIQIETADNKGKFSAIHKATLSKADSHVSFPETNAKVWKFAFRGDAGGYVVIRGMRFFINKEEFYPPAKIES